MFKKIMFMLLVALVVLVPASEAFASMESPIYIFVDGVKVGFPDQKPYVDENSRTLVPVRFVSEALGAKVGWEAKKSEVTVTDNAIGRTIKLWINRADYTINGKSHQMDTKAVLTAAGRTMVPFRFVSEALGCEVNYENVEGYGVIFNFTKKFTGNKEEIMEKIRNQVRREALGQFREVSQAEMKKGLEIEGLVTKTELNGHYWTKTIGPELQLAEVSYDELPVSIPANDMPLIIYDVWIDENYGGYDWRFNGPAGAIFVKANKNFKANIVCFDGEFRGGRPAVPIDENGKYNPNYRNGQIGIFEISLNGGGDRATVGDQKPLPKATKENLKWFVFYDDSFEVSSYSLSGVYIKNPYYKGE
ncbi:hypothetical protein BR63_03075 [Thermanaerosceptrum fracticalcis]|uniref:Copper amine oxidase-like N-terminal domain-containing protein n=2 Tax=Thermanaerosceptrum fracticalcis TaxID=1712410 RepID=A0A7G6DZX8_THEFR|nr:hypothetical protein BR63_03075 [Thermanaerosceptrum fracticalcis]